jgi:ribosomal protein S18 acetylase RimI-like enzyme
MHDRPTVRAAREADALELARLRWDLTFEGHEDEAVESRDAFAARFAERWSSFLASGRWFVAVAEGTVTEGRLIGCVWLEVVDRVPRPIRHADEMGYVTNVYVVPDRRNEGIGSRLLTTVMAESRRRGLAELFVWPSDASIAFYRRAGFSQSSEVYEMSLDAAD